MFSLLHLLTVYNSPYFPLVHFAVSLSYVGKTRFNTFYPSSLFLYLYSVHHLILTICIFQVKGKELSRLSGDPTLDIRDPVLSNILRRGARRRAGLAGAPGGLVPVTMGMADCVDSCTQTDISFQHMLALGKSSQHPCGAPPPPEPPPSPPLPPLLEPYLFNEL